MLSTIFGKKSDHPLATIKSAQAMLDDLPMGDAYGSLAEIADMVELLMKSNEFKLDHQLEMLRFLDEAAGSYVRKMSREYFTPYELNKFQGNRLWLGLSSWSNHISTAYLEILAGLSKIEKPNHTIKAQIPQLAVRTVHALMWKLKYICSHYGHVDNELWVSLLQIYKHAEQNQYLDSSENLSKSVARGSTVQSELSHMMIWHDAGLSVLSPKYIHLTERILAHFCDAIEFQTKPIQNSRLFFDLDKPAEPTRVNADSTSKSAIRFVGIAGMQSKLEELVKVLNKNIVPNDLNLGGSYEADVIKEAAQYLLNYVIAPPVRRNARREVNVTMNVVNGLEQVVVKAEAWIGFDEEDSMEWVTEEISASGFSCVIPVKGAESVGIGSLLGIQPDGVSHWGAAVVRRLVRDDENNQLRIGAEILSNQIASVMLNEKDAVSDSGQRALWLYARQNDKTGEAQMLMQADTFSSNKSLQISLVGKNYLLMPNVLEEKGLDYDLAKFRFVVKESASSEEV
ncbi:MAG: hypothetical protein R8M11_01305 [Gallionella sp.]